MRLIAMTAALAALAYAQDEANIDELIKKLGSEEFATREQAQAELVKIGAPALEKLKASMQSPDPEISLRSRQIVEQIRHNRVVESVLSAGTKVTLSLKDVPAAEAAKALGTAAGYKIELPEATAQKRVSLEVTQAEFLRALDSLGRQLNASYRFAGATGVVFSEEPFVDAPAAYAGPFKFKVLKIRTTTDNEITRKTSEIEFTLGVESEPSVKPVERSLRVVEAVEESGKKLEWAAEPASGAGPAGGPGMSVSSMTINGQTIRIVNDNGQLRVIREGASGAAGEASVPVTLRDVVGSPGTLQKLVCEAAFVIPSNENREVSFDKPAAGDTKSVGGIDVTIDEVTDRYIEVSVKAKNGLRAGAELLDKSSLLIKSGGTDYEAELMSDASLEDWDPRDARKLQRRIERMMRGGGVDSGGRFLVAVPKGAREKGVDVLKFAVKDVVEHKLPFEFKDLKLR